MQLGLCQAGLPSSLPALAGDLTCAPLPGHKVQRSSEDLLPAAEPIGPLARQLLMLRILAAE